MKAIILLSLLFLSNLSFAKKPMIEKLGFKKTDRVLIIHADDLGISNETNIGIEDTLKAGAVTSASIIIPGHKAKESIELLKDWDLGLHLALNSEWKNYRWAPILSPEQVPSMVEDRKVKEPFTGRMINPLHQRYGAAIAYAKTEHVEKEIRAQIQKSLDWGLKPTHIDTHMGTILGKVEWAKVYLRAARDFELAMMMPKPSKHLAAQIGEEQVRMLTPLLKRIEQLGFFTLDYLILGVPGDTFETRKASYMEAIKTLKPGITQFIVHPSLNTDGRISRRALVKRVLDVKVLTDPEFIELIKTENIKLTTWGAINKNYDWDKIPQILDFSEIK